MFRGWSRLDTEIKSPFWPSCNPTYFKLTIFSPTFSCEMKLNLDFLLSSLWDHLNLIRVYTKKPGHPPDFDDAIILRNVWFLVALSATLKVNEKIKIVMLLQGVTVKHVCHSIHRTLPAVFKYALVWVSRGLSTSQKVFFQFSICFFCRAPALSFRPKESDLYTKCMMRTWFKLSKNKNKLVLLSSNKE